MRTIAFAVALALAAGLPAAAFAQDEGPSTAEVDAVIEAAFPGLDEEWAARLAPDETMEQCNASANVPSDAVFEEIRARAAGTIVYPDDGVLVGSWENGEKLAQSGYGMRFSDYPPRRENGGNCYACHQLTPQEVSYGTLGPSLMGYGKLRDYSEEAVKAAYEKVYNPHMAFPCSMMPRFGTNGVLTIDQIKDIVALLMDPASPVNR
ncbi:sulfur oxidation c-type cytochrome SoxX [Salinarimonas ramus]|uniref:Sulfur oxidation c-type cytochrome SoxX n=1 Tax=Salinarimonas ramus TaxID=690164 RepID=A0A917QCT6_9HYPH|nr:sulfur oxidation c-type cytochrome SoxX [Salinarimonas ramus]GGK44467.1 sulfur oxidation c-type cytochrome SoxX [Salinarimonas ramus]